MTVAGKRWRILGGAGQMALILWALALADDINHYLLGIVLHVLLSLIFEVVSAESKASE